MISNSTHLLLTIRAHQLPKFLLKVEEHNSAARDSSSMTIGTLADEVSAHSRIRSVYAPENDWNRGCSSLDRSCLKFPFAETR